MAAPYKNSQQWEFCLSTGKLQDIVHQLDHTAGLHMDLLGKARHILRLCNSGLDQLRIAGNTGQRGLQLMADVLMTK